jgi:hypothetical protein
MDFRHASREAVAELVYHARQRFELPEVGRRPLLIEVFGQGLQFGHASQSLWYRARFGRSDAATRRLSVRVASNNRRTWSSVTLVPSAADKRVVICL